jgi:hypothetical protein
MANVGQHDVANYAWGTAAWYRQKRAGEPACWIRIFPVLKTELLQQVVQAGKQAFRFLFLDNVLNGRDAGDNNRSFFLPYLDKAQLYWLEDS